MEDCDRIAAAEEDIAEWFDWNRDRMATPSDLAGELALAPADVQAALARLLQTGEVERHGMGGHRAVGRAVTWA